MKRRDFLRLLGIGAIIPVVKVTEAKADKRTFREPFIFIEDGTADHVGEQKINVR